MFETLFLGKEFIRLKEVDSTNSYMKELLGNMPNKVEGVVIAADNQTLGRGQMGNVWESEIGKNITFSFLLKPKLKASDQFSLSKVVSLGVVDFLISLGIEDVKIKWPNDIYVDNNKIAGILIENTLKGSEIDNCVVGVGLNVNQISFLKPITNATSLQLLLKEEQNVEELLQRLLFFIEKNYLKLKALKYQEIDTTYLSNLYRINESHQFSIGGQEVEATIIGIASSGKLQLEMNDLVKEFDLQEVRFVS